MCSVSLAAAGLSAVTTAVQISAQNRIASAQAEAAEKAAETDLHLLELQEDQIIDQKNQEINERRMQAMREQAQLRVSFGEAGVLGNSPLRQLHTALLQSEKDVAQIESNKQDQLLQNQFERERVAARGQGRINQAESRMSGPLSSALQIGTSAAKSGLAVYQATK